MKHNKGSGDRLSSFTHNPQGTRGVLASLFREIAFGMKIQDLATWNALMTRFIDDPINAVPTGKKDRSSARGNLSKELMKNHLSWNVFCNKAMRFLGLTKFKITITAYREVGKMTIETVHERIIHLKIPLTAEESAAQAEYDKENTVSAEDAFEDVPPETLVTNVDLRPFPILNHGMEYAAPIPLNTIHND